MKGSIRWETTDEFPGGENTAFGKLYCVNLKSHLRSLFVVFSCPMSLFLFVLVFESNANMCGIRNSSTIRYKVHTARTIFEKTFAMRVSMPLLCIIRNMYLFFEISPVGSIFLICILRSKTNKVNRPTVLEAVKFLSRFSLSLWIR